MKANVRRVVTLALLGTAAALSWWIFPGRTTPARVPSGSVAVPVKTDAMFPKDRAAPVPAAGSGGETSAASPANAADRSPARSLLAQIGTALGSPDEADWERVLNGLFPALVLQDRAAAVNFVESFPPGERRAQLQQRLAREWASVDFAGAVAWIASLTNLAEQRAAFADACFGAAAINPAEAIHAWESFGFTGDDPVMENLVQSWAGKDLAAARAWVSGRPPSVRRDQAAARVAYVMAQTKPADAATFVIGEISPGPAQTEAAMSVLHQWAKSDLAGATNWAERFPPGPLADRATTELAGMTQYRVDNSPPARAY
jgi:hypothetical protein